MVTRWSVEEKALLRHHFDGTMMGYALVGTMIGRSPSSVQQQAHVLGIAKKQRAKARHQWTEEELLVLRRDFPPSNGERERLAERLGITKWQLNHQAALLGLLKATDHRRRVWTIMDDQSLQEWAPRVAVKGLAMKLHRSMTAVVVRMKRLGISRRVRDGWYTKMEACELLGVDHHWLQRRIDLGVLKATYHHGERPEAGGMRQWHIEEAALRTFVRTYPQELNGRNVDMLGIIELLAGMQEPARERAKESAR